MMRATFDQQAIIQALAEYLNARGRNHPIEGQIARLEIHRNEVILIWGDKDADTRTA